MQIATVDIGGTNARFAIAEVESGRITLGETITLPTGDYPDLLSAWNAAGKQLGRSLPASAAIAVAAPIKGEELKLTNNRWHIRPARLADELGLDRLTLVNDFGAVGHAVDRIEAGHLRHLCGPDRPFGDREVISVVGPGTGLGVAQIIRRPGGSLVMETEGGHADFAPVDDFEAALLDRLRASHDRVSVERVVSGPGLVAIRGTLALQGGGDALDGDDRQLWRSALDGRDALAGAALERFCLSLGSIAGNIALTQGATALVIAGGLGLRLADHLPRSGFAGRFVAKGRFGPMMAAMPVKLITHPQPGLYGAAVAFAKEHLA